MAADFLQCLEHIEKELCELLSKHQGSYKKTTSCDPHIKKQTKTQSAANCKNFQKQA
ncbi:MAG: hypothetical protein II978_01495 [Clostridia bacterium]|nr:hypothetical protein [Clostridia bacterium]